MLSQTNWLNTIRQSDDTHIGRNIVRLARLAQQTHVRAVEESLQASLREDQEQLKGIDLFPVTPRFSADGSNDRIRTEADS